ncbi:MAG: iron chelate uptake ABC transporter family permease subunit, partial [Bacteroidaceae bacterium]|nr:iron chelate uptake ABC transporter family permease subunit [Bacteroidaceae bacterium]
MRNCRSRRILSSVLLAIVMSLLFAANIFWGSVDIPASEVFAALTGDDGVSGTISMIVLHSRLPQAVTALLCGAALSV